MTNTRQQQMETRIEELERGLKAMDDRLSGELSTMKDSLASIRDLLAGLLAEKNKSSDGSGGGTSSNPNLEAHSEDGPRLSGTDTTASLPNFTPGAPQVSLPMFDGTGAEGWLTRIEQYFQLHNTPEANRLDIALVAMEGDALPWFQWVRATSPTMGWSGFKLEMVRIMQCRSNRVGFKMGKIMQCLFSGEKLDGIEMVPSSGKDNSASIHSSQSGEAERKLDTGNIEEAETPLRKSGSLNYEEARAVLGRYEYKKKNIEATLHVFEGIDIAAITPKMKTTLSAKGETRKRQSQNHAALPMSIHAVSVLFEAIFLKAKSLQAFGRYKEAAQSCSVVLDIVESSLPAGLLENFGANCKLQETLNKAVELLPELWKLDDSSREAVLSYRRALLHHWNLDAQTTTKIQKEFAVFLLYSGVEAIAPNLRFQMENAFIPQNNIEESILFLMILLRKVSLKRIEWDPSIFDHLSYALSISNGLETLANQIEELLPGVIDGKECYESLALCYHGKGDDLGAFNLRKQILKTQVDSTCSVVLLVVSKICGANLEYAVEGINFSQRAIDNLHGGCDQLMGVACCMLGISLSTYSRSAVTDIVRVQKQSEDDATWVEIAELLSQFSHSRLEDKAVWKGRGIVRDRVYRRRSKEKRANVGASEKP